MAKAKIDPLPILDLTDCVQELRRRGIPLPERGPWDTDEIYRGMCQEVRIFEYFFLLFGCSKFIRFLHFRDIENVTAHIR